MLQVVYEAKKLAKLVKKVKKYEDELEFINQLIKANPQAPRPTVKV